MTVCIGGRGITFPIYLYDQRKTNRRIHKRLLPQLPGWDKEKRKVKSTVEKNLFKKIF